MLYAYEFPTDCRHYLPLAMFIETLDLKTDYGMESLKHLMDVLRRAPPLAVKLGVTWMAEDYKWKSDVHGPEVFTLPGDCSEELFGLLWRNQGAGALVVEGRLLYLERLSDWVAEDGTGSKSDMMNTGEGWVRTAYALGEAPGKWPEPKIAV